jgi:hypothetical protein
MIALGALILGIVVVALAMLYVRGDEDGYR